MPSTKPSKKTSKTPEVSAAPVSAQIATTSKPANSTNSSPAAKAVAPKPTQASHRHSKIAVPAMPVTEEVISETVVVTSASPVSTEEISRLAYTFWEERNFAHGSPEDDWHRAVKTLSAKA